MTKSIKQRKAELEAQDIASLAGTRHIDKPEYVRRQVLITLWVVAMFVLAGLTYCLWHHWYVSILFLILIAPATNSREWLDYWNTYDERRRKANPDVGQHKP